MSLNPTGIRRRLKDRDTLAAVWVIMNHAPLFKSVFEAVVETGTLPDALKKEIKQLVTALQGGAAPQIQWHQIVELFTR